LSDVQSEQEMTEYCAHDNIIKSFSCLDLGTNACIVLEYCDFGGLDGLSTHLNETPMKYVTHSLLSGLGRMHDLNIMHRDIKPENVLVNGRGEIKLADLGLACPAKPGGHTAMAGTLDYFPPEFIFGEAVRYGRKADVWSLGVLIFALFEGQTPLGRLKADLTAEMEKEMMETGMMPTTEESNSGDNESYDFNEGLLLLLAQTLDLRTPKPSDELVRFLGRMNALESERATVTQLLLDPYMNQADWSVEKDAFQQVVSRMAK